MGGGPREVQWGTVWLGEGGLWGGAWKHLGALSEIPSKCSSSCGLGRIFSGTSSHTPASLNKNKIKTFPPLPLIQVEKKKTQKTHSVLSLHTSCPPSLFSLALSFLKVLYSKAKEYSSNSLGSGTWVGCRVSSHCRGAVPPLSHPALTRAGSHIRGRPGEHARFT